jgi:glycosyltransferase involved in cell wall biosynthesis
MPRILYVWKSAYPWDVRIEKFCKAFNAAGIEVIILCRYTGVRETIIENNGLIIHGLDTIEPSPLTLPFPYNPIWRYNISKAVKKYHPDLIMPREIMLAIDCAWAARKANIPVVMDMAENYPPAMKYWDKYKKHIYKLLVHVFNLPELNERIAVRKMDGIITVCDEQIKRLQKDYGYPAQKLVVVHNTPLIDSLKSSENFRKTGNALTFGHHGYLTTEKNIMTLLKAFISAAEENRNIKLLIAGGGMDLDDLRSEAAASSVKDRIEFTGNYINSDLPEILSRIDVGVMPYELNEFNNYTIHNKLFDYLLCGKPVITSNTKPFKRLINETGAGIAIDCSNSGTLKNAILEFSTKDLSEYSKNGMKVAKEKYNWKIDSDILVNFIRSYL